MMFTSQNQIKIVDRIDHLSEILTTEQIEAVLQGDGSDQILEAVSIEDLENTYLYQCEPVPQMLLEAFKAKASKLDFRVKQFAKHLERKTPTLSVSEVEVGKPKKSGAVAVQMVKIPFSDGQSISIAFHAPDNDPLKVNPDDTLIAFRFLMNSRDITHVVAPKGNMDLSVKEVTDKLGQLLESNSEKFVASKAKKDADAIALEEAQKKAQELDEQAAKLGEEATDLEQKLDDLTKKESRLKTQIDTQNEIQEELRKQLSVKRSAQKPESSSDMRHYETDPKKDPKGWLNEHLKKVSDYQYKRGEWATIYSPENGFSSDFRVSQKDANERMKQLAKEHPESEYRVISELLEDGRTKGYYIQKKRRSNEAEFSPSLTTEASAKRSEADSKSIDFESLKSGGASSKAINEYIEDNFEFGSKYFKDIIPKSGSRTSQALYVTGTYDLYKELSDSSVLQGYMVGKSALERLFASYLDLSDYDIRTISNAGMESGKSQNLGLDFEKALSKGYTKQQFQAFLRKAQGGVVEDDELGINAIGDVEPDQVDDELTEEERIVQNKKWLLDLIGRKTIAKGWKMDKGELNEPFVYFEAPDSDDDTGFGNYLISVRDNQILRVSYGEGSPLEGGDDIKSWEAAKSLILADYHRESKLLQDMDDSNEEPQPIESDEPNANGQDRDETSDNLFWYGLRLRPYGFSTTPPQHQVVKYLDPESAKEQFSDAGHGIRHGAIAYDQKLPPELVSNFDLEPLFGMVEGDLEEAQRIATEALDQWVEDKGVDTIPQSTLDTLKNVSFKSAFAKQLRQQPEMKNRKNNPKAYKLWSASIDLVTPEMIQEIAEDLMLVQSEAELQRQAEHTQGRMRFQETALSKLKDMQSVSPIERKRLVILADMALKTGKTLKRGEKVSDQAKRISEQASLVDSLRGETLASLDSQFKNRQEIIRFLTEQRIPFQRRATRENLLNSILKYRDDFFSATGRMFELRAMRGELYERFENGEALALKDVEQAFGAATVYHQGDVAYTKAKGETIIPAMEDQGEDYKKVERFIKAIDDESYPDLSELSSDELFAQHYSMAVVSNQEILAINGFRYLMNDEQIDGEPMARAIHNSSNPLWYTYAIEAEYESRGLPSLAELTNLSHKGQFRATRESRYAAVGVIGQSNFSVIDTHTGKVQETGLEGAQAQNKANQLNEKAVKESTIAIFNMLKEGKTLEQIAEQEYSLLLEPVSPAMFTTINGFESLHSPLAINGSGSIHARPTLRDNAEKHLAVVDDNGKLNGVLLNEEYESQMERSFGLQLFEANTKSGKKLMLVAHPNSRSYLTIKGANTLLELMGLKNAVKSDAADEVSKALSEEEKQFLSLDPSAFSEGSIYDKERIKDSGQIAKRIRAYIAQLKKEGRISKDVKISVRNPRYGTIELSLTDLPQNVMLYNPAYLQFLIDNPTSPLPHGVSRYSEPVTQLFDFVNAYVSQYNYDKSDLMTDYYDVNFYGGKLNVDFNFGKEREVIEMASLTEIHHQGDEAEDAFNQSLLLEQLDKDEVENLEWVQSFTDVQLRFGKQNVTLPTGKVTSFSASNYMELAYQVDFLGDLLREDLDKKAISQLESLIGLNTKNYVNESGQHMMFSFTDSVRRKYGMVPDDAYSDRYISTWGSLTDVDVFPIAKGGQFRFAAYHRDKFLGEFDDASEFESIVVSAFNLTSFPLAENKGNGDEVLHVEKLKEIRDFNGEPSPELVEEFQTALEQAYAFFEANDLVAENEALMDSALSNITGMIQAQI